jgi:hypothetical protein
MHRDAEMCDVVVILDELPEERTHEVVKKLEAAGLAVSQVDDNRSVVEGSVEHCKVDGLKSVENVRYVRTTLHYSVEYPPTDPRDRNKM